MSQSISRKRSLGAFTLLEVLLVLAILGVIAGMVVPRLVGRQKHANEDVTRLTIKGIEQALKLYALDHFGEFPSTQSGLQALVTAPSQDASRWRGPYVEAVPRDAWGRTLNYAIPGKINPQTYDIISAGPDGSFGSADDITNALQEGRR